MTKFLTATAIAAALLAGGASFAKAGTATANLTVNVTLQANCTFTAGTLAGNYLPGAGPLTVTNAAAVTVGCSQGAVNPTVSFGAGGSGNIAARTAANGANKLAYNLFTLPAGGVLLGDGTLGSTTVAVAGSTVATPKQVPVSMIVPDNAANQALPTGLYTDTVVATLAF